MAFMPTIPRVMAFIDGENLVARFQEMLAQGYEAAEGIAHVKDAYVWHPSFVVPGIYEPVRATYYASVVGADERVEAIATDLRHLQFSSGGHGPFRPALYPKVFKKPRKSYKTSIVDVQLVVDMLSQVYQGTVDTVLLLAGDSDFRALIEEVAHRGRRIFVGALSSGRHPLVAARADLFIDVDQVFFKPRAS